MSAVFISVQGIAKRFAEPSGRGMLTVFEDVWFDVAKGEFACLIGHSGCGKSTILNALAGLDTASDGTIIVGGKHVAGPSLDRAVIFQGHALMPWLTARGNVELAVSSRHPGWTRDRVREHASKYLELVHLSEAADKKPSQLSGGMKQRVGIARALSIEPQILLMDEPFSALDALTRGSLQDEVVAIRQQSEQTVFMITHDVDEALLLADKILLMTNGPHARIAEIVVNTLPKPRSRTTLHKQPNFYPLRNHLIEFLVTRSREMAGPNREGVDPRNPPVIMPTAGVNTDEAAATASQSAKTPVGPASPLDGGRKGRRIGAQGAAGRATRANPREPGIALRLNRKTDTAFSRQKGR
jgi:nitrate/nitrite transport system ATP-binding protein